MSKLKVKFLSNLRFEERYVTSCLVDALPTVNLRDIHVTPSFAIVVLDSQDDVAKFLAPAISKKLEEKQLKPVPSQSFLVNKAIFVTKLRPYIINSPYNSILYNINNSNKYKASGVFKLPSKRTGTTSSIKVVFEQPEAVDYVMRHGLRLFDILVSPANIHKEDLVQIPQCFRCFSYSHVTRDCPTNVQRCSICSANHHYKECDRPNQLKCVQCGGAHSSTFVRCPVRKQQVTFIQRSSTPAPPNPSHFPPLSTPTSVPASSIPPQANPGPSTSYPPVSYASVTRSTPQIPPPPSHPRSPLPSRMTKLTPRTSRPVPRSITSSSYTSAPALVHSATSPTPPPSSNPPPGFPPRPATYATVAAPSTSVPVSTAPTPPSSPTPPPPQPSPFNNELYIAFKIVSKLADRLAGDNHYLYATIMNNFLTASNLPAFDVDEIFRIAKHSIPVNIPQASPPSPNSSASESDAHSPPPSPTHSRSDSASQSSTSPHSSPSHSEEGSPSPSQSILIPNPPPPSSTPVSAPVTSSAITTTTTVSSATSVISPCSSSLSLTPSLNSVPLCSVLVNPLPPPSPLNLPSSPSSSLNLQLSIPSQESTAVSSISSQYDLKLSPSPPVSTSRARGQPTTLFPSTTSSSLHPSYPSSSSKLSTIIESSPSLFSTYESNNPQSQLHSPPSPLSTDSQSIFITQRDPPYSLRSSSTKSSSSSSRNSSRSSSPECLPNSKMP